MLKSGPEGVKLTDSGRAGQTAGEAKDGFHNSSLTARLNEGRISRAAACPRDGWQRLRAEPWKSCTRGVQALCNSRESALQ